MADHYIDAIGGNDSANGLTQETAWASLTKLNGLNPGNGSTIWLASGSVWDYADSWDTYKAHTTFPYNCSDNLRSTDSANPIKVIPYYPRGEQGAPVIRWYASIQASEWSHEPSIGPNAWSIPWVGTQTCKDFCMAHGHDNAIAVMACQQVEGQPYGTNGTNPYQMLNYGDYTKANNKVYFCAPSNPTEYFGSVKIFGLHGTFSSAWQGMHNFILDGIRFELCKAVQCANASASPVRGLVVRNCEIHKAIIGYFNNANSAPVQECELSIYDNVLSYIPQPAIHIRSLTGTNNVGNTWSWEIYGNRIEHGNLSSGWGGALAYIQCNGGAKHIAHHNYGFDCRNGTGGNNIDGAMIYADVYTDGCLITQNIAEQCGMPYQQNNAKNCEISSNVAIDCPYFCQTTGAPDAPTAGIVCSVKHNTWLWTGRVTIDSIPIGPGIPSFNAIYAQWNDGGAVHPFDSYTCVSNLAVDLTGTLAGVKLLESHKSDYITTTTVSGNAALGLGSGTLVTDRLTSGVVDQTGTAVAVIGAVDDALEWLPACATGDVTLVTGALVGAGDSAAMPYGDYRGRVFKSPPCIGACERDPLALIHNMIF